MTGVRLVGLDFGTTTSSAVVASAQLTHNAVTGKSELVGLREEFRSELVFTPFIDDRIDERALRQQVATWISRAHLSADTIFGGGALITGLAAQRDNVAAVVTSIRRQLHNSLIATADDPRLESWLAFMGSCAGLSRDHPHAPVLNLDIGGGTTNIALGLNGHVVRTACLNIGARHVEVHPGTYRILRISEHGQRHLASLKIVKTVGEALTEAEVGRLVDAYFESMFAFGDGRGAPTAPSTLGEDPPRDWFTAFHADPIVTLSGGVGALVYDRLRGRDWPSTTRFGDLGVDLARRLLDSRWADSLRVHTPASAGRATVYGLLRHSTDVSGRTLFLPYPECLPLTDVPLLGRITHDSSDAHLTHLVTLIDASRYGACIVVDSRADAVAVRGLAERIASALQRIRSIATQPLVLLVRQNVGKALGNYITEWGKRPWKLIVIDEITVPSAQFVRIGRLTNQVVPVSFYGLRDDGGSDDTTNPVG